MFSPIELLIFGLGITALLLFRIISNRLSISNKTLVDLNIELEEYNKHSNEKIDFKYAEQAMKFMDVIIYNKYKFYMYTILIPIYLDQKVPEKKLINDLKEKIYVSVVGGLTTQTKKSILNFFTEKGIEIYIHEKILVHMNETDFKTSGKYSEAFRDIKPNTKLDSLIP